MKRKLRNYLITTMAIIIVLMIITYSLLVQFSLHTVLIDAVTYDIKLKARDFALAYKENPEVRPPNEKYIYSYFSEEELPTWFRTFIKPSQAVGTVEYGELNHPQFYDGEDFFFLSYVQELHDGKQVYYIQTYLEGNELEGEFRNWDRAQNLTLYMGIMFILLSGGSMLFFFLRISAPIHQLKRWAKNLDTKKSEANHPDFKFDEINQIADFIKDSAYDLQQALDREHNFLRHASHELRTPIAIIRSNVDLLDRLVSNPDSAEKKSYDRIRRSTDNMQNLTETLLWLSRKEDAMPVSEEFNLKQCVEELLHDHHYLLSGKNIELDTELIDVMVYFPKTAIQIILSNLIRNAFQYTHYGKISVFLCDKFIKITNTTNNEDNTNEYGYGIGLMLVKQISEKLSLQYQSESDEEEFKCSLIFK